MGLDGRGERRGGVSRRLESKAKRLVNNFEHAVGYPFAPDGKPTSTGSKSYPCALTEELEILGNVFCFGDEGGVERRRPMIVNEQIVSEQQVFPPPSGADMAVDGSRPTPSALKRRRV